MRIAIIGLGDIARKAYLPVIAGRGDVQPVLCTRNAAAMHDVAGQYRISHTASSLDELLRLQDRPAAAFVHTSTDSHPEVVMRLIEAGLDVYVDKPLAYTYREAEALVDLAEKKQRLLMVGFNRRFAPMVARLKQAGNPPELVVMQKNRRPLPDTARRFVFDDFIHVVDTMRFLMEEDASDIRVSVRRENGMLYRAMLQLEGEACTAVGIMNRNSGMVEERLEVSRADDKTVVENLFATTRYVGGEEQRQVFGDWDSVLHRRGFPQAVSHFIECVSRRTPLSIAPEDALKTHEVCEHMLAKIGDEG